MIRRNSTGTILLDNCEVIYHFLPGHTSYVTMAKIYRGYLIKEKNVIPLKARIINNPVLDYAVNAMRVKIFMAGKTPFVSDGSSPCKVYTTTKQAIQIIDAMKNAGIDRAVITLVGWNSGGHDGNYPTRFPVEPAIGGEAGLKELIAYAINHGYQIVPHDNVTDGYRNSPDFDYEFVARQNNGEPLAAGIWGGGQSYKFCPLVYLNRYGYEFEKIMTLGFAGSYYLDAQSTVLWHCESQKHPADEKQFAMAFSRITSIPREIFGAIAIELATTYSLPFIDEVARIHNAFSNPLLVNRCSEEFRSIFTRGVPFNHLAVHGLVLYQDRWIHEYTQNGGTIEHGRLVELIIGARPSMEISYLPSPNSDNYLSSIPEAAKSYRWCFDELKVQAEFIEGFEEIAPGVYSITYSNGMVLKVNTSNNTFENIKAQRHRWSL